MAVELTFEMRPDFHIVARAFDDLAAEMAMMAWPLEQAALIAAQDSEARFASEGPGWADWALGYQWPPGHGTIGDLTGEMRARAGDVGSYEVMPNMGGGTVSFGFNNEKESAFQFGNSRQPARPFIGLSPEGEDLVELAFGAWLDSLIGGFVSGGFDSGMPFGVSLTNIAGFGGTSVFRGAGGRFVSNPFK